MPLFDLTPKSSRRTLFARDHEYEDLQRLVLAGRWSVILGPRMSGKTSLAKAAAFGSKRPTVYVNLWGARGTAGLLSAFVQGFNSSRTLLRTLTRGLRRVEGVSIAGTGLTIAPTNRPLSTVHDLVNVIGNEGGRHVIILDEVQEVAPVSGPLLKLLGNVFSTYPNVVFIFTGSEFGLIRTLLEPDSSSPLYGRSPASMRLGPFVPETSVEFLLAGLREYGLSADRTSLADVVNRSLDGIPGWLALYGNHLAIRRMGSKAAEQATVAEGIKVVRSEIIHYLRGRDPELHWVALRATTNPTSWSEIREAIERRRGSAVNDQTIQRVLGELTSSGLITNSEKRYSISDPMVRRFVSSSPRPPSR